MGNHGGDLALLAVAALARLTRLARDPRSALVRWAAWAVRSRPREAGKLLSPEAKGQRLPVRGLWKLRTPDSSDAAQCRGWPQKAGARDATAKASAAVHFHCTRISAASACVPALALFALLAFEQSTYIWVSILRPEASRHLLCPVLCSIHSKADESLASRRQNQERLWDSRIYLSLSLCIAASRSTALGQPLDNLRGSPLFRLAAVMSVGSRQK